MKIPTHVSVLIERIESAGYEAYVVGGAVRDMLLESTPDDFDIATSARPERILEIFSDMRTIPTGIRHGTVTVMSDSRGVEITTYRVDGEYADARHPTSVEFTDKLSLDLSRRDFTVNAMAYSEKRGLVDLFGGEADLERGIIRAVGEPTERFSEDALRIMRAFRFASKLGFEIDGPTFLAAVEKRAGLSMVARERISAELLKLLCGVGASSACARMKEAGLFPYVFGEYEPTDKAIAALSAARCVPQIRLGILLSDADGDTCRAALCGLRLSKELSEGARRIAQAAGESYSDFSPQGCRRFIAKHRELTSDVLDALLCLGKICKTDASEVLRTVAQGHCVCISDLPVGGEELLAIGFSGREIGEVLDALLERVIEDPTLCTREALLEIAERVFSAKTNK